MGEPTFLDWLGISARHPLPWLPWLTALAAFGMSWSRDLRPYALGVLVAAVQLAILVMALEALLEVACITDCPCSIFLSDFLSFSPAIWTPVVVLGIPTLLRTPREQFDRPFRRTALVTAVMALDVSVASLTTFILAAEACPYGHDWRVIFDLRP